MKYPKNITLRKLNTLPEAPYPQQDKYPDGSERTGLMWEHTLPKVGEAFYVMASKMWPTFHTSFIEEILSETSEKITFRTLNSTYELEIK